LHSAEQLAGDSLFDKLDPYCIVKLGEIKRFQTPVEWNAGTAVSFDYKGKFTYADEEVLELIVMDRDNMSQDDLCGLVQVNPLDIPDAGWDQKPVTLKRAKKGLFFGDDSNEEFAGKLFVSAHWDFEEPPPPRRAPRERFYRNHKLLRVEAKGLFGHEQIVLETDFRSALERGCQSLPYALRVTSRIRLVAEGTSGSEVATVWKVSGDRFKTFLQRSAREKLFSKECSLDLIGRQRAVKEVCKGLIKQWEYEMKQEELWGKNLNASCGASAEEPPMDPSRFMVAYRGMKARITVKNAMNLPDGSWFDKLDPYAVVRFRNSKAEFRTSVLKDAGGEPFWDCEGDLLYNGEGELQVQVFDYDRFFADNLIAEGHLAVSAFYNGYEGTVMLEQPGGKKSKWGRKPKQMAIVLGVTWSNPPGGGSPEASEAKENVSYYSESELAPFHEQPSFTSQPFSHQANAPPAWRGA